MLLFDSDQSDFHTNLDYGSIGHNRENSGAKFLLFRGINILIEKDHFNKFRGFWPYGKV